MNVIGKERKAKLRRWSRGRCRRKLSNPDGVRFVAVHTVLDCLGSASCGCISTVEQTHIVRMTTQESLSSFSEDKGLGWRDWRLTVS